MTEFTSEVYLTAARIAYPKEKYIWDEDRGYVRLDLPRERGAMPLVQFNPYINGDDYRALREALEQGYGFFMTWSQEEQGWVSECHPQHLGSIFGILEDKYIVNLMMRNVQALIEAGVAE